MLCPWAGKRFRDFICDCQRRGNGLWAVGCNRSVRANCHAHVPGFGDGSMNRREFVTFIGGVSVASTMAAHASFSPDRQDRRADGHQRYGPEASYWAVPTGDLQGYLVADMTRASGNGLPTRNTLACTKPRDRAGALACVAIITHTGVGRTGHSCKMEWCSSAATGGLKCRTIWICA